MIKSGVLHVLKYAFLKAQHSLRMPSRNFWGFFCTLNGVEKSTSFVSFRPKAMRGMLAESLKATKDKYVADLCNPYDINSQQSKHMIAGQQDLSFFLKKGTKYSIQVRTNRKYTSATDWWLKRRLYGLCEYIYPGNTLWKHTKP